LTRHVFVECAEFTLGAFDSNVPRGYAKYVDLQDTWRTSLSLCAWVQTSLRLATLACFIVPLGVQALRHTRPWPRAKFDSLPGPAQRR